MFAIGLLEILKLVIYGLVEGITEWLPVSSTGHLILLEEWLPLSLSDEFLAFFRVAIQLAAILAVIIHFWSQLWPLQRSAESRHLTWNTQVLQLWVKIIIATIPAGLVGFFFSDVFEQYFYHPLSVAIALIVVAFLFLIVEEARRGVKPVCHDLADLDLKLCLGIGLCQMVAGVFPGVSRSGACILGGLIFGLARPLATSFSFYLAIPVMLGASLLKLLQLSSIPASGEFLALALASVVAFVVSLLTIRFLLNFVEKHSFKVFAIYRIVLGFVVILLLVV